MTIHLRHTSIDYSHYDAAILHETFSVICFRVKGEIDDKDLQLPLTFRNGSDAREAYIRILQARNASERCVSLADLDCTWPADTAQRIRQYAQSIYDYNRPTTI